MTTVSYGITNTADDALSIPAYATNSYSVALFGDISFISPGAKSTCALRFPGVGVGATDTVTAATITLTRHDGGPAIATNPGSGGANAGTIKGVAVANQGTLPVDLTTLTKTTASTTIVPSATVVLDVLAQVNEIRAIPGWAAGNAMAFVGDPSTADTNGFIEIYDYASSTSLCAQLSITYTTGGAPAPTLNTLTTTPAVLKVAVDAPVGTVIGTISGQTAGSTLSINPAFSEVSLVGNEVRVASSLDFAYQAGGFGFEVVETLAGATNSPKSTNFYVVVTAPRICEFIAAGVSTTVPSIPAHIAGDLILVWLFRDGSTTAPLTPTGFTSLATGSGNATSYRVAYKIATAPGTSGGGALTSTSTITHIYRPAAGYALSMGASARATGASTTVSYPALTLQDTSGPSWVVGFSGHRSTNTTLETAPIGMTARSTAFDSTDEAAGHDTNGGVTSWPARSVAVGGTSSGWISATAEIKGTATSPNTRKLTRHSYWL